MDFSYTSCTVEELADHFLTLSTQAITQQLSYYKQRKNIDMVLKIQKARILSKQKTLSVKLSLL